MKGLKKVIKGLKKGAPPPAEAREGWGGNGTKDDVGKLARKPGGGMNPQCTLRASAWASSGLLRLSEQSDRFE